MRKTEGFEKEIEYVKNFIAYVKKGYGKKVCTYRNQKDFHPNCANCQAQWSLGWLNEHLSLIEWEFKVLKKDK